MTGVGTAVGGGLVGLDAAVLVDDEEVDGGATTLTLVRSLSGQYEEHAGRIGAIGGSGKVIVVGAADPGCPHRPRARYLQGTGSPSTVAVPLKMAGLGRPWEDVAPRRASMRAP